MCAIVADKIAANAITADKIDVGALKTTNYAEYSDGLPRTGAKLDKTGDALRVAFGSNQMGYRGAIHWDGGSVLSLDTGAFSGVGIASVVWDATYRCARVTLTHAAPDTNYLVLAQQVTAGDCRATNVTTSDFLLVAYQNNGAAGAISLYSGIRFWVLSFW